MNIIGDIDREGKKTANPDNLSGLGHSSDASLDMTIDIYRGSETDAFKVKLDPAVGQVIAEKEVPAVPSYTAP